MELIISFARPTVHWLTTVVGQPAANNATTVR
jgi:hypothetical protein